MVVDTTGVTGAFSLNVPFGTYTITATLENHIFGFPATGQVVGVTAGQDYTFGKIQAKTASARGVSAVRLLGVGEGDARRTDRYNGNAEVTWTAVAADVPDGYNAATYLIQTCVVVTTGDNQAACAATATGETDGWDNIDVAVVPEATGATKDTITVTTNSGGAFKVRVVATVTDNEADPVQPLLKLRSDVASVGSVDPSADSVKAVRLDGGSTEEDQDTIHVTWNATTSTDSDFRVVVRVNAASAGTDVWFVAPDAVIGGNLNRRQQVREAELRQQRRDYL